MKSEKRQNEGKCLPSAPFPRTTAQAERCALTRQLAETAQQKVAFAMIQYPANIIIYEKAHQNHEMGMKTCSKVRIMRAELARSACSFSFKAPL
jgi:hypothetical protein